MRDTETFTCDVCGETFPKAWSDEEAWAEATATFSAEELEATGIVCEDCWAEMRDAMPDFDKRYSS